MNKDRLMKYLLLLFIPNMISISSNAVYICDENPTYCQIVKNSPQIDKRYALELSKFINKVGSLYSIKPARLAAILAQESRYRLGAINHVSKDYGIAQINHKTVEAFGFDKEKLLTDLEYSVKAGAIVLSDIKKRYGHREVDYWTRYNSSKPSKREVYKKLVMRFM